MVVALPIKRQVNIYHSPDLLHWTKSSEFGTRTDGEGEWECPDLFPLTLEDGSVKWVLVVSIGGGTEIGGSATKYFVGDFDGAQFLPDKASDEGKWLDYGPDFYAFQSWYNIHHDEKGATGIAWMNNRAYAHYIPTFPWRGAMTLPRIMKLVNIAGEFLISQKPIAQLNKQRRRELFNLPKQALLMKKEFVELGDQTPLSIEFSIEPSSAADNAIIETKIYLNHLHYVRLVIDTHARTFILDRSNSGYGFNRLGDELFYKSYVAPIPVGLNKCDVRIILDRSSIEVFAFDGLVTFTANLLTVQKNRKLIITNLTNEKCSVQAKVWSLGSIWQEDP
jgi:fructan beta-fructosidase